MKILVLGGGGREHVIAKKLKDEGNHVDTYPGNGGIPSVIDIEGGSDIRRVVHYTNACHYDLLVPGPEQPLVDGIVDLANEVGLKAFGPTAYATKLEGSKIFAKIFADTLGIRTAPFRFFDNPKIAKEYAENYFKKNNKLLVAKVDGLAGGKGVIVPNSLDELLIGIDSIMVKNEFADAGNKIVLEEFLHGIEISYLVFTDGKTFKPLLTSQDHKPVYDNDKGKNTGGMGAYSPVPFVSKELEQRIQEEIVIPTIKGMRMQNTPYRGVLYFGLMLVPDEKGNLIPYLLEYNCRFGDPEAQAILPMMETKLAGVMIDCTENDELEKYDIQWKNGYACCVNLTTKGYPEDIYKNNLGKEIHGLDILEGRDDVFVFHAGTKKEDGKIVSAGGRVVGITAIGETLKIAIEKAYSVIGNDGIWFEGMHFRKDIGEKGLIDLYKILR